MGRSALPAGILLLGLLASSAHARLGDPPPRALASKAGPRADLVVTVAGRAPAALRPSQELTATVAVRNRGRRRAGRSVVRFFLSANGRRDARDVRLDGLLAVKRLKPRGTARGSARLRAPGSLHGGAFRMLACADDLARVREGNERNNCRVAPGRVRVAGAAAPPGPPAPPQSPAPDGGPGAPDPGSPPAELPAPGDGPPAHPQPPTPLERGAATPLADAVAFLYQGRDAIQQGVAPGTISDKRIAVLRGRVLDADGKPLEGVRVTVLDHGEYGRTWTRADGHFDMAVNGARLNLVYAKDGYLPMQREVDAPWQDYLAVEDAIMVRPDAQVTRIDPDSTEPFQVARGSSGDGTAPATLLFARGTKATMEMPDGSTRPAPGMSVRATEFPAGSQRSLPGTMPGNVGPTYAVEFTLDEAISAGAESVSFDRPVINYTGNFIDAPVGGAVPTAYYDRGRGEWIPQPNGRVIAIAGESDGRALVDADETPGPDSAESLAALGITDAERAQLAELYAPGQELWRVPIEHFTPWDHNNPYGPPRGAKPPKLKEFEWKDPNDPCNRRGSIIACESQTLGEEIPLTGTGLRLRYDSSRQAGTVATRALEIPITDGTVPPRLQGIELTIDVAGRHIVKRWCDPSFPATGASTCQGMDPIAPDLHHRFEWDGRDAYGRPVTGRPYATITVTYVYELTLYESNDEMDASFGAFPPEDFTLLDGAAYCGNQNPAADPEANRLQHFYCGVLVKQTAQRALGRWDAGEVDGLGGLTISAHHGYDPNEKVVYRGDGGVIRSDPLGAVTRTLVNSGDYLTEIATGPDGSVYWHTSQGENRIWRLTPGGERQLVGGRERGTTNADRGEPTGDGGPAVDAVLGNTSVDGMDVGPDGSVYFTVEGANGTAGYVRRIRPDGIIETLAGVPWDSTLPTGSNGDGGPALAAKLGPLQGLDVAPDGSIYFGERDARPNGFKNLLRRITADGAITTVAGGGADLAADDEDLGAGEPALDQQLRRVYGVAAAEDGSVYLSDPVSKVVQRVGTDGRITRVAGTHGIGIGYGANGADAAIGEPTDLALARDGELYVRTNDFASGGSEVKIVRVDTGNGLVTPIAGRTNAYPGCVYCLSPEGEAAGATMIESNTVGLVALPDGRLVYGDGRDQVRTIEPALQGFDTDAIAVPSPEGAEVYVFNGRGRHLRTLDAVTGVRLWSFAYDDAKRLVAVTDRDGRSIRIERAADGRPTAVVAPGGARTAIGLDAAGRAERVVNPAQEVTTLGYGADGLLASFALPGRPPARFDYDDEGRLVRDESPTGAVQTLARTETGLSTTVKITSGEGRVTKYVAEALPNGDRRRAIVRPSGATVELLVKPDGTRVRTAPDGTRTTTTVDRDPRWGMRVPVPVSEVTETPGGRRATTEVNRAVSLATPTDPLSLQSLTTTVTRRAAGRTPRVARSTYTASTRTVEHTSATGKRTTATLDEAGRVVEVDPDGPSQGALAPVRTTFDAAGHVTRIAQGAQHWSFAYDGRDRVVSRTDAKGRVVSFGYDDADRIVRKTFPGDRVYGYAWRGDGALKSLTMPSGAVYAYAADDAQRPVSMALPGAGSYARTLDGDGALELLRLPSGATRDPSLDAAGRETATDYGPERDALAFPADDERPERLERIPDTGAAQSLTLAHDGFLPKLAELGGPAAGRYAYAFDDFLELTGTTLESGGDTVATAMAYDADGHATKQGPFTLTRNGPGGRLSALADGTLAGTFAYDALGRLKQRQLSAGGAVRYANEVAYGAAGQVESRTERVGETTRTFAYDYDANGRLREVRRGGELVESYDYDANGNRIARTLGGGPLETSAYDGQDRITRRGQTAHVVDADGFLRERGADRLEYSPSGALLSVRVDGDTVRYGYDALGRRVSRVDGAGTAQYLYGNPGNAFLLTATRDAGGRLTTYLYDEEDALYALERGGVRYYVGADQVGSPRVVFKGDGTIVKEVAYDAFGGVVADSDPAFELAIGFAGGLADGATGLVRFGLRDYDPASGRFTARDPIFFSGSPTNLYAYANSDPVSLRDPTGLWCVGGGGFVGVGGGMQYCRDEGKNSICVEGGVGAGGGFEVDPFGEVAKTGSSLQGELTGKYGPVNGTLGFELDLDCFNLKGSAKLGTAIGTAVSVDTDGGMSSTWGGSGEEDFNGRGVRKRDGSWGGKTEGKLVVKGCAQF